MRSLRQIFRAEIRKRQMRKFTDRLMHEIYDVNPFRPVRSAEEMQELVPSIDEELGKFAASVDNTTIQLGYVLRDAPMPFSLAYALSGREPPKHRANPYMLFLMECATEHPVDNIILDLNALRNGRKNVMKLATSKSYEATKQISPENIDIANMMSGFNTWQTVRESSERVRNAKDPEGFAEALGKVLESLEKYDVSKRDCSDLAAHFHGLNMGDYMATGLVSQFLGKENPYTPIFNLSKLGVNVLDFAEVGDKKRILVYCPMQYKGSPVWGVYIQGEGAVRHYNGWKDPVNSSARQFNEGIVLPYEVKAPMPSSY